MPEREEIEAPEFDEQAITDILVAIDDTLWGCGRERMDLIDGPTVDALRDAVKRELVAFVARSAPQGEDHEAGIKAARRAAGVLRCHGGFRFDEALVEPVIAAYLSRVSPSRDGTVAVEDVRAKTIAEVVAWLREPPTYNALRLAANAIEREFGPARAGESNEGGNQ